MWRNLVLAAVVVCVIWASITQADIFLTLDGDDKTDEIAFGEYPGQFIVAIEGNTPFEPNQISVEAVNGTLEDVGDGNESYYFQLATSGEAMVNLITEVNMIIDGHLIPADTLIYQLWMCYNSDANIYAAYGIGLADLIPPEEEEGGQGDSLEGNSSDTQTNLMEQISDDSNEGSMGIESIIEIDSDITTNQIWTANNTYHITAGINVQALLVIEPGTVIEFAPDTWMAVNSGGVLISAGTPDNPIIYTSDSTEPWYSDYSCAIFIEETASASTKITYNYIEYSEYGIWVMNNRLDSPIENNYLYNNTFGILEYGVKHTDIKNNLIYASYYNAIEINMESYDGLADAGSHILVQNNTCEHYQDIGINVYGSANETDAGEIDLINNIVSGYYKYGISWSEGWLIFNVHNTGYYSNIPNSAYKDWEFDEYNPVYESTMPYINGTGTLPICYLRSTSVFVNASDEYIEQTPLIGKTTDINSFPDSNRADLGFHYPNWNYSNAGDGDLSTDLNHDLIVNFKDLAVLADGWRITYDINDLNTMADEWLKTVGTPIAVTISGDSNNLAGNVDFGISGRSPSTTQGFIYIDGELKGYFDYTRDQETRYEVESVDTRAFGNGHHAIKAVTVDSNGLIIVSPIMQVNMNNSVYYVSGADDFNSGEDYRLCAMSTLPNNLRIDLVGWDGIIVWSSEPCVGGINVVIPSNVLTDPLYDLYIIKEPESLLGDSLLSPTYDLGEQSEELFFDEMTPGEEAIWNRAISRDYPLNVGYKVAIFLPNVHGSAGATCENSRKEAVAQLVKNCQRNHMSYVVLYAEKCTWESFAHVLSYSDVSYVYMVTHGGKQIGDVPRSYFYVKNYFGPISWDEMVVSYKGGLPSDVENNPRVHSMGSLRLYNSTHIRLVYITACYLGETMEMAGQWLNSEFGIINQIFCSWEGLVWLDGENLANPPAENWKQWDKNFWSFWLDTNDVTYARDHARDADATYGYDFEEVFKPMGDTSVTFTPQGNP